MSHLLVRLREVFNWGTANHVPFVMYENKGRITTGPLWLREIREYRDFDWLFREQALVPFELVLTNLQRFDFELKSV
jgi:hypothetical protein